MRGGRGCGWARVIAVVYAVTIAFAPTVGAEYGDVVINRASEREGVRPVVFPHWFHRIRFKCAVCHTELGFRMRAGGNEMKMADIVAGKYCGACHNERIAWGPDRCHLCHSGLPGLQTGVYGGSETRGPGKF